MIEGEPPLDELLAEPIIGLMAKSDGISVDELTALCNTFREKLARTLDQPKFYQEQALSGTTHHSADFTFNLGAQSLAFSRRQVGDLRVVRAIG